jgi:hypothetical protein
MAWWSKKINTTVPASTSSSNSIAAGGAFTTAGANTAPNSSMGVSAGGITYTPYVQSGSGNYITYPTTTTTGTNPTWGGFNTTGGTTWITTSGYAILKQYYVFMLPKKKLPNKVYVQGHLRTVGLIGSAVEVAYIGLNKLVFIGKMFENDISNITISLEYKNEIYHYKVDSNSLYIEKSSVLAAELLSCQKLT